MVYPHHKYVHLKGRGDGGDYGTPEKQLLPVEGGFQMTREQRLRLASCGRLPPQESRSQSKVKTRPQIPDNSLVIATLKKCYKTEAMVS